MISLLLKWWCGLTGHDYIVRKQDNGLFCECLNCGDTTRGFTVDRKFLGK